MKRMISIITVATILLCCLSAGLNASAVTTVSDGTYTYTYNNNSWLLYSYLGEDGDITLPQSLNGLPVTGIYEECFITNAVITSVEIPDGYTSIGNYAFYGCHNLKTVSFPESINSIGMGAFTSSGIESADLSDTKINAVSAYCFKNCAALQSVELPEAVTLIGIEAFYGTGLTGIEIPNYVTAIGDSAFYGCGQLAEVDFPKNLKKIGTSCFESSGLTKAVLPDGLETIGASAFRSCGSLSDIYIPTSVSYIGGYALYPMSLSGTVTVYCFDDSYAETYCYENFVKNYVTVKEVYGDTDQSGFVSIIDVTLLQRYLAGMIEIDNPLTVKLLDVDLNGKIDVDDATIMQKCIAKIYDGLPVYG